VAHDSDGSASLRDAERIEDRRPPQELGSIEPGKLATWSSLTRAVDDFTHQHIIGDEERRTVRSDT